MIQHEKELILVCWHIGPEVVAKERYKIFLDLGKFIHFIHIPLQSNDQDTDEKNPSRTIPRKCHMPKSINNSIIETPTVYATT
jgi:hypothetical protein